MKISVEGLALIKKFEGLELNATNVQQEFGQLDMVTLRESLKDKQYKRQKQTKCS